MEGVTLITVCLLAMAGCGHTTAFVRPGMATADHREGQVASRVLLIGDAGAAAARGEPVLIALTEWAKQIPDKTLIVFLGDNVYPSGFDAKPEAIRRLNTLLEVVRASQATPLFIPGNHDWKPEDNDQRERDYIIKAYEKGFPILLRCPGPEYVDWHGVRLIALDSEWWLKQRGAEACRPANGSVVREEQVKQKIRELLEGTPTPVIVVAHHPFESHGPHGGFFDWQDHLFPLTRITRYAWLPLPVVGSLYPLLRPAVQDPQDLQSPRYRALKDFLDDALSKSQRPPLVYASGHEHSLQVMEGGCIAGYHLVSGLGSQSEATPVSDGPNTLFAHEQHAGFMVVDILTDHRVRLTVVEAAQGDRTGTPIWSTWLTRSPACRRGVAETAPAR